MPPKSRTPRAGTVSPRKRRPSSAALRAEALVARAATSLPAFLPTQRWFGSKARRIAGVTAVDHTIVPESSGVLALFHVHYADGPGETYLIPLLESEGTIGFRDAMEEPAFSRTLVEQIRSNLSLPGGQGAFRFSAGPVLTDILPGPAENVVPVQTEQSNSSVVFDGKAILKLFRRVAPGLNPDFEIPDFLTRRTAFRGVPRLAGSISYNTDRGVTTLAVLQEFVVSQGEAWTATLDRLAEYFSALDDSRQEPESRRAFARTLAAADAEEARHLGEVTGRLHMALTSDPSDPAFAPEPIQAGDVEAWLMGMRRGVDEAMGGLESALTTLPDPTRAVAQQVLDLGPRLQMELEGLRRLGEGVSKIRVHGDYHLGQVLKTAEGFAILDFEGEPARPLEERRAKQCALKDVAGMLRSLDYAVHAGLFAALEQVPSTLRQAQGSGQGSLDESQVEELTSWAERWLAAVRDAFLNGYLAETWQAGAAFLPRERESLEGLLRVFELDKAAYEVSYELNHRPDWLRIPLEGLRRTAVPSPVPRAAGLRPGEGPFMFVACLELLEFVGARAENERQLAEFLEEVPLDSIYYHTHSFYLRHRFVAGAYPNDFASWAAVQVRDRVLGERLAMVDPGLFPSLQALREELVAIIDEHLRGLQLIPGVIFGEPFDFIQSRIVEIPTGIQARTLQEFRDVLLEVDLSAIYFHLMESRLRLGRNQNDFAAWLEQGLGLPHLAAKIRGVDPYAGSLERTRSRLVQLCDEALAEVGHP